MSGVGQASADGDDVTRVISGGPSHAPVSPGLAVDDGATVVVPGGFSSPTVTPEAAPVADGQPDAGLLAVGSRVAEFEVTRVIGQGGFGVVYEAWDHTLERVVALKEYLPASLSTRVADGTVVPLSERHRETFDLGMRSFINEAKLLAQFDHPSLLKVYRFWQERGTTYMVMPFYRGDTLRQALAASPGGVDEPWLLDIMDGVTQALAVMHGANCYHRDIAPDNIILLEDSGRPVVLDFGAARRVITDKTQAMTVILKPGYAPIEQYAEIPDMAQGPWTDVYALAAVMHVAVCGRSPPPSVARMLTDSYVPLTGNEALSKRYSQRLLAAIDAGLGVRPEARPQSMDELRHVLGLDGRADAPPLRTARASGPATKASGRGPQLVALAVVVGVGLAAGAWWWLDRDTVRASAAAAGNGAAPTAEAPPPATVTPASPRTPLQSLQALAEGATQGFVVTASARKPEVSIGKDTLGFELRSNRDGYAYVYLLASGGEMSLLFPNLLDKYNKVVANTPLVLPRASWPMNAGGPAGTDQFFVLVSENERDYSTSGLLNEGVFPQFQPSVLAALEAARGTGPTPALGKPICPSASPCRDSYGVGNFKIIEK